MGKAAQVLLFARVAGEHKMQVTELLLQPEQTYIFGAVALAVVTLFYLFQVAQGWVGVALAHGEGAVGKIQQHAAALQVVARDGVGGVAFGGMRQHQYT